MHNRVRERIEESKEVKLISSASVDKIEYFNLTEYL
jgi:hypothetical protein